MSKRSTDLVRYVRFLVNSGVLKEPVWLQAMQQCPPLPQRAGKKPATITFPEDRLLQAYYAKYPEAKLEPVALGSFEPTMARKFVMRQMALMEAGMERKAAFRQVEEELSRFRQQEEKAKAGTQAGGLLAQIQREEEAHLRKALREYNLRRGHKAAT